MFYCNSIYILLLFIEISNAFLNFNLLQLTHNNKIRTILNNKNITTDIPYFTRYSLPISKVSIEKIRYYVDNMQVKKVYITSDYDRVIVELLNNKKYVYYIDNEIEKKLFNDIINFIEKKKQNVKFIIICDKYVFTDKFGYLYSNRE